MSFDMINPDNTVILVALEDELPEALVQKWSVVFDGCRNAP